MQNVEYKAELRDPDLARTSVRALRGLPIITVHQRDTYFRLPDGRLLRREAPNEPIEWIYYHRPNRVRPRLSTFTILTDEQARTRWGSRGLPTWLTVEKTRELWMMENVAIAFDHVTDLGSFCELTAMLSAECDASACFDRISALRDRLDPSLGESISASYSDLAAAELEHLAGHE